MVVPILITLSIQISWHYYIGMILMLSCDATHLIELPKAKSQSGNYIGNTWTSGNLPMAGSCARSEFSNWRTFCCYPSRNYIHIPVNAIQCTLFCKCFHTLASVGSKMATFMTIRQSCNDYFKPRILPKNEWTNSFVLLSKVSSCVIGT